MQSRQNRATPSLSLEDTVENEAVVVDGEEDYGNDMYGNLTSPFNFGGVQSS